jgi:hypothetical protein
MKQEIYLARIYRGKIGSETEIYTNEYLRTGEFDKYTCFSLFPTLASPKKRVTWREESFT